MVVGSYLGRGYPGIFVDQTSRMTSLGGNHSSSSSSPASIAFDLLSAALLFFFSNNFFNPFTTLNTPPVPALQAAQLGFFLYLFNAQDSQKLCPHFVTIGSLYGSRHIMQAKGMFPSTTSSSSELSTSAFRSALAILVPPVTFFPLVTFSHS